jgi:UDP-GlcNAc:undecaprenyl-phosphate GlcNAc-1-phosphate transferase
MIDQQSLIWILIIVFVSCIAGTIALNSVLLKFLKTLGTKNQPGKVMVRWSEQSKPATGGISFFICFLFSLIAAFFMAGASGFPSLKLVGWILAGSLAFFSGLADDAYNTRPGMKFISQSVCAFTLILTGTSISYFQIPALDMLLTYFWVVGLMNSLNMLDNMDAITSIVSIFILILFLILASTFESQQSFPFIIFLGMCGSLLGFLYHNWHPSKLFMGDSGSQLLGLLLAAGGIRFCWNLQLGDNPEIRNLVLPLLVFILPIADTTLVSINRIRNKRSPFVGGRDHSTHHLSYLGFKDNTIGIIFALLSLVHMTFAIIISLFITEWTPAYTVLCSSYLLIVIITVFFIASRNMKKGLYKYVK